MIEFELEVVSVDQENKITLLYAPMDENEISITMQWKYPKDTYRVDDILGEKYHLTIEGSNK